MSIIIAGQTLNNHLVPSTGKHKGFALLPHTAIVRIVGR